MPCCLQSTFMISKAQPCVDRFPAAEIVRIPLAAMPAGASAYTDGHRIFMPIGVSSADERTIIRHESAHIWLRHFRRRQTRQPELWAVACEMEIARNIYDAQDLRTMADRSSVLHGGYQPDSVPDCPAELKLAEEIYEWLMAQAQPIHVKCGCGKCGQGVVTPGGEAAEASTQAKPGEVREALDESERQTKLQKSVASSVKQQRPPTLASEMDALFRAAFSRDRSYRRPSRREIDSGLLERGRINHIRTPLVQIYVDRSGSFSAAKTATAEDLLNRLLVKYRVRIKADTFFFGNSRLEQNDFGGGGNTPYDLVISHINQTAPAVAVVITDDDEASGCGHVDTKTKVIVFPIDCRETKLGQAIGAMHCHEAT